MIQRGDGTPVDNWDIPIKIAVQGGDAKFTQESLNFV